MNKHHCRPLTKRPALAQTSNLQIKQFFFNDMAIYSRNLQRSKPWGAVLLPIFGGVDAADPGDGGDGGGDIGGDVGGVF